MAMDHRLDLPVLKDMTLRRRLVLTLTCMALVLVLPALYAIERIDEIRDIAFELKGKHGAAEVALSRLETGLAEVDVVLRRYIADPSPEGRAVVFEAIGNTRAELGSLVKAGYGEETVETSKALSHLDAVTLELERLVYRGEVAGATDFFFEEVQPALTGIHATLKPVSLTVDHLSDAATERAAELASSSASTIPLAVMISLGFAVAIGILIVGKLVNPLQQLRKAMARVARGEFQAPPELSSHRVDELGDLNRSFVWMTEQLADLNRIKAEFVSIVTHDLKTPINVLGGYAEMLQEGTYGEFSEQQRNVLGAMEEQVEVLLGQVNQLVNLSRYESGSFRVEVEELYLADLCTSLQRAFEALARQKGIRFEMELDPQVPATIEADADRLRNEVLGNILGNAFKFTASGGRVRVKLRPDLPRRDRVLIEVADSGVGIPADELPHVFEMYYQGESGARLRGSGIGLAIAKEIVEAHAGEIRVDSEPGRGTTFRITLPVVGPSSDNDKLARKEPPSTPLAETTPPDLKLVS